MPDLITFLRARLDEDEAAARAAHLPGVRWQQGGKGGVIEVYGHGTVGDWVAQPEHSDAEPYEQHIARWDPARVLAEVASKRAVLEIEATPRTLGDWMPDCGGDWCLGGGAGEGEPGIGWFANYWPDNTVSASISVDGAGRVNSGIVTRGSRAKCQAFAEEWIGANLANVNPVLLALAQPYADHPDFDPSWRA